VPHVDESIAELRQIADGGNDILAEAAGITAGSWYASPATHRRLIHRRTLPLSTQGGQKLNTWAGVAEARLAIKITWPSL
jgi:hypothetical protein